MVNETIILGLLVVPYLIAYLFHSHNLTLAGRVGICLVLLFGALGHFFKTDSMISMLPSFVPARRAVIYVSGVFEILVAIAVVSMRNPLYVGWMIILYLIAIFPSNVYAAIHRIPFGGHSMGPRASGTWGSRCFRLDSEQRVPSPKHFFQFVIENLRPRLQKQMRPA